MALHSLIPDIDDLCYCCDKMRAPTLHKHTAESKMLLLHVEYRQGFEIIKYDERIVCLLTGPLPPYKLSETLTQLHLQICY